MAVKVTGWPTSGTRGTQSRSRAWAGPQTVTVRVSGQPVDTFALEKPGEVLRRVPLTAAQLGGGNTVELRIGVDRTFVPASVPGSGSKDARELGVRVFHAFVEPR